MKKTNKIFLGLGTLATTAVATTIVIVCGMGNDSSNKNIIYSSIHTTTPASTVPDVQQITEDDIKGIITLTGNEGSGKLIFINLDGIALISLDNNGSFSNGNVVALVIEYEAGYTGPATVTYTIAGLLAPTVPEIQITEDDIKATVTVSGVEGSGTLTFNNPTGATISVANNGSLSNGDVTLNVAYDPGYTGPTTVTYTIAGLTAPDVVITDQQIIDAVTVSGVEGSGTLTFDNPTGATISVDKNGSLPNHYTVVLRVAYDLGYTGPSSVLYTITGLTLKITEDDIKAAVTVSGEDGNGTLTFNNPTGATISVANNGSLSNGDVTLNVAYETTHTGPDTVTYTITGLVANMEINPLFDDLVIQTHDSKNGGTTLETKENLPEGVESVVIAPTSVDKGVTQEVIVTINYVIGYTGPDTVVQEVIGADKDISPNFSELVIYSATITGGTSLEAKSKENLPEGIESIVIDSASVDKGDKQTVTITITYATGYTGPTTVVQDIVGGSTNITPTFGELVESSEDSTNGGTTLAQSATLPTGVGSIILDKTKVDAGKTETVIATITYTDGYAGPETVNAQITGASREINLLFDDLVIQTRDSTNGGTTLAQIATLPTGVGSIILDKTKVDAGKTETVTATITYVIGYTGPEKVKQDIVGQNAITKADTDLGWQVWTGIGFGIVGLIALIIFAIRSHKRK